MTSRRATPLALSLTLAIVAACGGATQEPPREATKTETHDDPLGSGSKVKQPCGGPGMALCPSGYHCMDDANDVCDPKKDGATCPGVCLAQACGSAASCAGGYDCVDDPSDSCDPSKNGGQCPGICIATKIDTCGGVGNRKCPSGKRCIDDASDGCNPKLNPDCPGLCVP
jgi:hypothetical protein